MAVAASGRPDADAGSLFPRVLVDRTVVIDRQGYENVLAGVTGFIVPRAPPGPGLGVRGLTIHTGHIGQITIMIHRE